MFKFLSLISLSVQSLSQATQGPVLMPGPVMVGGENDANGCLIGAGYTWCDSHQSCIRSWETPCSDNFKDCNDCLNKQAQGMNIACPVECSNIDTIVMPLNKPNGAKATQQLGTVSVSYPNPEPMLPTDPLPTDPLPTDPLPTDPLPPTTPMGTVCPEVMCMMYCGNGYVQDTRGCQLCSCLENIPYPVPRPMPPIPAPVPVPVEGDAECPIPITDCNNEYVCPKVQEVTHCSQGGIPGFTTYKLSLLIKNPIVRTIYAIYGDDDGGGINERPMIIPAAYQSPSFNSNIGGPNSYILSIDHAANYDSWLTMNLDNGDPYGTLSSVGIDFDSWTNIQGIYTTDGAIFTTAALDLNMNDEYVVGQITIPNDVVTDVIMNFQGKIVCSGCTSRNTWTETQVTFHLSKPEVVDPNSIPLNCKSWYDGCNTCRVNNGILGGCTRLMCFREDNPYCLSFNDLTQHAGH